jgi:hypothetical protein
VVKLPTFNRILDYRNSLLHATLALPLEKELRYPLGTRLDISHNRARLDALENIKDLCLADSSWRPNL